MENLGSYPGSIRRLVVGLVVAILALAVSVGNGSGSGQVSGAQDADTIPPGFDLFETDPEQTVFRFRDQAAIPAGFFDQGSQRFEGDVALGGVPIERFHNRDTGDADTVVERKSAATVPNGSSSQPIQIELVRLSLASAAPIEVQVGEARQTWSVRAEVSPTRPSTGQMSIARDRVDGGTFSSRLTVYPKFIFTRFEDNVTRELDVGALPDSQRPEDTLTAERVPWRRGCIRPALAIPGLNEGFCPGLHRRRTKHLTLEQGLFARHGVWPVQPGLEHFNCYSVTNSSPPFQPRVVALDDQFGNRPGVKVSARDQFCNPVRKNNGRFVNSRDHLRCHVIDSGPAQSYRRVAIRNQFHFFLARVHQPQRLCLPSSKRLFPGVPPTIKFSTEHFQCYRLQPLQFPFLVLRDPYATRKVTLRDQFGQSVVKVGKPYSLCAPVAKNGRRVDHRVRHLVCYRYKRSPFFRTVRVRNQFGLETLRTRLPQALCVPSFKVRLGG